MVMATNVSQIQALVASCLDYTPARNKVVYTALNFPTVSYVWQEEQRRGAEVVVVPGRRRRARADGAAARGDRRAHAHRADLARAVPLARRSRTSPRVVARAK